MIVSGPVRVLEDGRVEQRSNGGCWAQGVCRGQSSNRGVSSQKVSFSGSQRTHKIYLGSFTFCQSIFSFTWSENGNSNASVQIELHNVYEGSKDGKKDKSGGQREGHELNNRIFSHNLDFETTSQTFMLLASPSPLCPFASVKRSPHLSCDEPSKVSFDDSYFA
jgi:hypothetical protein